MLVFVLGMIIGAGAGIALSAFMLAVEGSDEENRRLVRVLEAERRS